MIRLLFLFGGGGYAERCYSQLRGQGMVEVLVRIKKVVAVGFTLTLLCTQLHWLNHIIKQDK